MQTRKVLSNISYNSLDFFEYKVNDLVNRNVFDWCYWIYHFADTDETKNHIHFVFKPSRALDTFDLRKEFFEVDSNNPSKPLTCTTKFKFTNSMDDWLLYAVHDQAYLSSKNQKRNIRYDFADLRASDEDALRSDWNSIDRTKFDRLRLLLEAAENNVPFVFLVQSGVIPIPQRAQFEKQYDALVNLSRSSSSGRVTSHEVDSETGEFL